MSALNSQIGYYNAEWSIAERGYANSLQLARAIAVLQEIIATGCVRPRICELGAGTGWLTAMLGCVGDTLGVELSDVAVQMASQRFSHVRFECADATTWAYPPGSFDIVVSHEVVEHIEDQQRYIDVAHGLLKTGGHLILTTPNARTVLAMPEESRSHQPIENILTKEQLQVLVRSRFEAVRVRSLILRGGQKGLYRLVNSMKVRAVLGKVGLRAAFEASALRAGFGLHLIATGKKTS